MIAFLFALLLSTPTTFAGDKINNGGGIWICENSDLEITSSVLVDLYEAENEFKWTLIQPTASDPWKIVEGVNASLPARFPSQASAWAQGLSEVRARFNYIQGELSIADDSHFRAKPLPSLCRTGGGWHYRQFANWDDRSDHGIIREDYWLSSRISALDKATLVWHEVIYRWLRKTYNDIDSTRARELVGVVFAENVAEFTADQARARVNEILNRKPPVDPTDPAGTWFCAVEHEQSEIWHTGYALTKAEASRKALASCRESGDFMGMMCTNPGKSVECGQLEAQEKFTCVVPYGHGRDEKKFTAKGRSVLEARIKSLQACRDAVGKDGSWGCNSRDVECK